MIARTFHEVQIQTGRQRAELAEQEKRLKSRLAQLKQGIVRLAQSNGHEDAVAPELQKLNAEYGETQSLLQEAEHALEALASGGPSENEVREALAKLDPLWDELFPAEKGRIVRLLVEEVILSRDGLLIRLRLNGLNSLVAELQGQGRAEVGGDGQTVDIRVPMEFKVRGGRREIILPPDAHTTADVGPRSPLVLALARAYRWQRMLDTGEVASLEELADRYDVDRSYVSRIINLASLAPNTVVAILAGQEPSGLSLSRMHRNLPLRWDEQLKILCGLTS